MKKIFLYDPQLNEIKEYKDIKDILQEYPNLKKKGIESCLNGKQKTTKNLFISYDKKIISKQLLTKESFKTEKIGEKTNLDNNPPYNVKDNTYYWTSKYKVDGELINKKWEIDVHLADKLFFEYSKYGMDLTALQTRIRNDISIEHWHSLKNRLSLYKESDIFSPHSRNKLTASEYQNLVDEKLEQLHLFQKRIVVDRYQEHIAKKGKKAIKVANNKRFVIESILQEIYNWEETRKDKTVKLSYNNSKKFDYQHITLCLSDLHLGVELFENYNRIGYNTDDFIEIIKKIVDRVNSYRSKSVSLVIAGDIIHSWTGNMHEGMFKDMDKYMLGTKGAFKIIEILEEHLIGKINNLIEVISVSGNHDRYSDNYKQDPEGEIAEMIMRIIERDYRGNKNLKFYHDNYLLSKQLSDWNLILLHGNTRTENKQEGLIHDYGKPGMFNLILSGDKHTRGCLFDTSYSRHVRIPSIYTGDNYSTKSGYSSTPGCLIIHSEFGIPQITDYTISYKRKN